MQYLATAAQMRELDRTAIQERGMSSLALMENAAQAVAGAVRELIGPPQQRGPDATSTVIFVRRGEGGPTEQERREMDAIHAVVESKDTDTTPRVAVFCGPGNNGGDGMAAARLLLEAGYAVRTFFVGEPREMSADATVMEARLIAAGGELEPFRISRGKICFEDQLMLTWLSTCDCMVDALFGIGLSRPVEGDFRSAIQVIDSRRCPVVACDVPSGVHSDTGEILGKAVEARITVTFTCGKPGLYLGEGAAHAGEVRVADIGVPVDLVHEKIFQGPKTVQTLAGGTYLLPRRPRTAHKGKFGRICILAGSVGFTGAPVLAANAAVRAGAGLVSLGVPREIWPIVAVKCDEAMPFPLPDGYEELLEKVRRYDVVLIGPGLGREAQTEELVLRLLEDLDVPVVLDADGLNALAGRQEVLDRRRAPTVLTPHEGEFARLTGCVLPVRDRLRAARDLAKAHRCVVVLKGHGTVTAAPDGRAYINTTGGPGMARGGSGDALAGLLTGLMGQEHLLRGAGMDLVELVALGTYYHGCAGDLAAKDRGEYGMTVGDLIARIPDVLAEHVEKL